MQSDSQHRRVSVTIVGAGPTGLTAANLLGMAGIDTLLIERNAGLSNYPRALTIDDEGLRISQAIGLLDQLSKELLIGIEAHYISRGHFLAQVGSMLQSNGYPLISTFHQPTLEAILLDGLTRFPCVEIRFQQTLEAFEQDEHSIQLTVRTEANIHMLIECAYVLACDGGKSTLRQALGIPMRSPSQFSIERAGSKRTSDHKQRWLVVDCINDTDATNSAIFFCNPARPAVTVPAPRHGRRWEFLLLPGEQATDVRSEKFIHSLIKQARSLQYGDDAPLYNDMAPPQIARSAVYTFHATLAQDFARGRVFLLGDAAHLMPPFGGQGMNSGLRDAYNLCWKLALVLHRQARSRLLATYQQERRPHVAQMIRFSSLLGTVIMPNTQFSAFLRDIFFHGVNTVALLRTLLSEGRVKPQPRYRQGCLISSHGLMSKSPLGKLLPQPSVQTPEGTHLLLDNVLDNSFAVLWLYENLGDVCVGSDHKCWRRLGTRFVCIYPGGSALEQAVGKNVIAVIDEQNMLKRWLGRYCNRYVLVRPDRYIMGVFAAGEGDGFAEVLLAYLLA